MSFINNLVWDLRYYKLVVRTYLEVMQKIPTVRKYRHYGWSWTAIGRKLDELER